MDRERFDFLLENPEFERYRRLAYEIHENVNQFYDEVHPYGMHLDMVAFWAKKYAHKILEDENDFSPLFFGVYFHDTIEDARLTYSDILKIAEANGMDAGQAHCAAEIVYALTNDKGRTRAERAGEKYYEGIRNTPYAPFVKACDRLANYSYSRNKCTSGVNSKMYEVYRKEMPHFISAITADTADRRFLVPQELIEEFI